MTHPGRSARWPSSPPGDVQGREMAALCASGLPGGLRFEDGLQFGEVRLVLPADHAGHQGLEKPEDASQFDLVGEGDLGSPGRDFEGVDVVGPKRPRDRPVGERRPRLQLCHFDDDSRDRAPRYGDSVWGMDVALLYFDDCPNWRVADQRLAAIAAERPDVVVTRHRVETVEQAELLRFHGSPSILVDGVDVFADPGAGVGLSCRVYRTPQGLAGAPTMEQLRAALGAADAGLRDA